jgi:BirA family biotin operon repressor/biotin-[acetyl-CoA-carboxylase] ligase
MINESSLKTNNINLFFLLKTIKIHTTTSTNDVLKEMLRQNDVENFTCVWALHQTAGRGQRGNSWVTESGKNLTFSILIKLNSFNILKQFELNQLISLSILDVLKRYLPVVQLKWPNDILADHRKIAGILIENTIQGNLIKHSIVGIGLNVNQTEFDSSLSLATSMKKILEIELNLDDLLLEIQKSISIRINQLKNKNFILIDKEYTQNLYGWQEWKTYRTENKTLFEGKIIGVSPEGKLMIENRDFKIKAFEMKEISFVI